MTDHPDFSVIVKNEGAAQWEWEIYRAGRKSPIKRSEVFFSNEAEANRAGRKALTLFLSNFQNEAPR
ncbi:MAG TPA: DUF3622 domain-containing protein [Pseudolabrys sp.]|nr:DUF3622 domain-containing protein [Pseudolabrys sp.]